MSAVVYRFFDADGRLLYVGSTGNLARRLREHESATAWFGTVSSIDVQHIPDLDVARDVEIRTIAAERPLRNIQGKGYGPAVIPAPGCASDLVSTAEAASILGRSIAQVNRYAAGGRLPVHVQASGRFYVRAGVEALHRELSAETAAAEHDGSAA